MRLRRPRVLPFPTPAQSPPTGGSPPRRYPGLVATLSLDAKEVARWGQSAHTHRDPTGDPRAGRVPRGDSGPGWGGPGDPRPSKPMIAVYQIRQITSTRSKTPLTGIGTGVGQTRWSIAFLSPT